MGWLFTEMQAEFFFFLSFFFSRGGSLVELDWRDGEGERTSLVRERERGKRGEGWQYRDPRRDSSIRDRRETGRLAVRRYFPPPEDPRRSLLLSDCYLHPGCLHCFNVIRDRSLCLPIRCAFGGILAEGFAQKEGGGM